MNHRDGFMGPFLLPKWWGWILLWKERVVVLTKSGGEQIPSQGFQAFMQHVERLF